MRSLLLLAPLLCSFIVNSQTGSYTDPRDGQQYSTIDIGGKKWFREHLRFQTRHSFCPHYNKDSADCRDGNYYSYSELETICPPGWHVATIPEWEEYLAILVKQHAINGGIVRYDTSSFVKSHFSISMKEGQLFNDSLLLLKPTGWVEGLKLVKNNTLSLWAIDVMTNDIRYHVHLGDQGFIKHSHDHHIFDKPKKVRKFPVRCVCEMPTPGSSIK
jgi:uncharacterized protein (TIGR02145 family)